MTAIPAVLTTTELCTWLTEHVGDKIPHQRGTVDSLLTAFDFASKTSTSLNNPHHIDAALDDARDPDEGPFHFRPVSASAAAEQLTEQFRITRKPDDHARLFIDLPMPIVVSRHQCPFCRRFTRADIEQVNDHMTRCWKNPTLRCCKTCAYHQDADAYSDESCTNPAGPEWEDYRFPVLHCPLWKAAGHA